MRKLPAGAALAVLLAAPALANYVFVHQVLGDWSIVCWRDSIGGDRTCRLRAPPASLDVRRPPNVIAVVEYAPDAFRVEVTVRDVVVAGLPLYLRVDGFPVHEAALREGKAAWDGDRARMILGQMRAGKRLVYRVQTAPDGLPSDTVISLETFRAALAGYRRALRAHDLLGAGGEAKGEPAPPAAGPPPHHQ